VVLLAERDHPVERLGDRGVLVGGAVGPIRSENEGEAAGREHPVKLRHRGPIVRDVLEHVAAEDQFEGAVGQVHFGDVESQVGWDVEVGGDALDRCQPGEYGIEEGLGGEVEESPARHVAPGEEQSDRTVARM